MLINIAYSLKICKSAYYEPVAEPGNMENCGKKSIWCLAGFTLAVTYVDEDVPMLEDATTLSWSSAAVSE